MTVRASIPGVAAARTGHVPPAHQTMSRACAPAATGAYGISDARWLRRYARVNSRALSGLTEKQRDSGPAGTIQNELTP